MEAPSRANDLIESVRGVGFDEVATLPLREAGDERYADWIADGFHGGLEYLERHAPMKRDPATHFPEWTHLVVVLKEYGAEPAPEEDPGIGNISRYALGDDYHDVLKARLFEAADAVRSRFPEFSCKAFIDTGPLNEKLIAARAGLGWQGKHTNLIHPRRGSWFFLGLLLVDMDLPRLAEQEKDRCGACDACIPACPTGAIVAPYRLDARRCISWLTIEQRGPIPRAYRKPIGHRIFGCDDCQAVCPWNRFARSEAPPEFAPREGQRATLLAEWLTMDIDEWRRRFRRSAVKRTGFVGFLRNCLVAAGNARDPNLVPVLVAHLGSEEPILRGHAAWALGRHGGEAALTALRKREDEEQDPEVLEELRAALVDAEA